MTTASRRTSRATGAVVGSDRARSTFGWYGKRGPAGAFGGHGATRSQRMVRRSNRARSTPSGSERYVAFGRGARNGAVVQEPKELWPPQLDSAKSVPYDTRTEGSGNRASVTWCLGFEAGQPVSSPKSGIARHAARRDGRCEQVETKANARPSTSGGPVHSSSPGRRVGESPQRQPGRLRFPTSNPKNPAGVALSATLTRHFGSDRVLAPTQFRGGTGVSGLERGQRRAAARRFTRARSSRTRFASGPGKNATSSAPASTSASA